MLMAPKDCEFPVDLTVGTFKREDMISSPCQEEREEDQKYIKCAHCNTQDMIFVAVMAQNFVQIVRNDEWWSKEQEPCFHEFRPPFWYGYQRIELFTRDILNIAKRYHLTNSFLVDTRRRVHLKVRIACEILTSRNDTQLINLQWSYVIAYLSWLARSIKVCKRCNGSTSQLLYSTSLLHRVECLFISCPEHYYSDALNAPCTLGQHPQPGIAVSRSCPGWSHTVSSLRLENIPGYRFDSSLSIEWYIYSKTNNGECAAQCILELWRYLYSSFV